MNRPFYLFLLMATLTSFISCKSASRVLGQNIPASNQDNHLIQVTPSQMEVDKLGNIYVLDEKGHLLLYNNKGIKKYEFADKRLGKISSFDVSNPLNILIYFKDQGVIKVLDNTLTEVSILNLTAQGKHGSAGAIALSNDNHIWLHDVQLQKIIKLDKDLKILVETNQFNDIGHVKFIPNKIVERNNWLAVSSQLSGIMIFDNFGQYAKFFDITGIIDFQFDGDRMIILTKNGIKMQKIDYPDLYEVNPPKGVNIEQVKNLRLENEKWYIAYSDGIDCFDK